MNLSPLHRIIMMAVVFFASCDSPKNPPEKDLDAKWKVGTPTCTRSQNSSCTVLACPVQVPVQQDQEAGPCYHCDTAILDSAGKLSASPAESSLCYQAPMWS